MSPVARLKAIKNPVEIRGMKNAHVIGTIQINITIDNICYIHFNDWHKIITKPAIGHQYCFSLLTCATAN